MIDVTDIIRKIDLLKPVPVMVQKIVHYLGDPDSPLSDVVTLVERDPAITANLLKICNSAHFGLVGKVDSVQRAVSLLGVDRIAELVLTYGLSQNLHMALEGYSLAKGDLWKQSVAGALLAKNLAELRQLENLAVIYTAALLKDIGKVILHDYVADKADEIQELVRKQGLSFVEAEKACIGMDHAALGARIAESWYFSPQLTFMIENHHLTAPDARANAAASALYWSDMVAMMVGTGIGVDCLAYHVYEESFEAFCLSREELRALMPMYQGYLKGAERLMNLC